MSKPCDRIISGGGRFNAAWFVSYDLLVNLAQLQAQKDILTLNVWPKNAMLPRARVACLGYASQPLERPKQAEYVSSH